MESGKYGEITYKTKLLGMVPSHWQFPEDTTSPWKIEALKVVKKPSEYTRGRLEVSDQGTLTETAIVERLKWEGELGNKLVDNSNDFIDESPETQSESSNNSSDPTITNETGIAAETSTKSPNLGESSSSKECVGKSKSPEEPEESSEGSEQSSEASEEEESNPPATRFVRQCFNHLKADPPDFLCERLAAINLGVETKSYVLRTRKYRFTSKFDPDLKEYEAIEIRFVCLRNINEAAGRNFASWSVIKDEDLISSSLKSIYVSGHSETSPDKEEDDVSQIHPYHCSFIQGELTKNVFSKTRPRKFTLIMSAQIAGVWNYEDNPDNYTCSHLAETKTANVKTIESDAFYKSVRMLRNWFQAHLAGMKSYLVGVNEIVGEKMHVKELRLYDTERIPNAILRSADAEGFDPWFPDNINQRLFMALEFIKETVNEPKADEKCTFIHYDNSDYLYYDQDGSLLQNYTDMKRVLIIRNIPKTPSTSTPKDHTINQLKTIIRCVGYFPNQPLPSFVRYDDTIKLTFISYELARAFQSIVIAYWMKKQNIPGGFENMRIVEPVIREPKNFNGKRVRIGFDKPETGVRGSHQRRNINR